MGLMRRFQQVSAGFKEISAAASAAADDAAAARAEWGDGGTARPGWTSALGGVVARDDTVPQAEIDRLAAHAQQAQALLTNGREGTAVIQAARDTGERVGGHAVLDIDLVLRSAPDGDRDELTIRLPVCGIDIRDYGSQGTHAVRFDPSDPRQLAFVPDHPEPTSHSRGHIRTTKRPNRIGLLPGRAVVEGADVLVQTGEVSNAVEANVSLQLRQPGNLLATPVFCAAFVDWRVGKLIKRGLDVPTSVHPVTGTLDDLIVEALTEELRPQFDQFSQLDELFVEPLREVRDNAKAAGRLAADIGTGRLFKVDQPTENGFAPGDPILAPAHGVTLEQWAAVTAELMRVHATSEGADAVAQQHGVAPGAWAEGQRQWQRRQAGHPLMAQMLDGALKRAQAAASSR